MSLPEVLLAPLGRLLHGRRADERLSIVRTLAGADGPAITVTSPAFPPGGTIPARFCGRWIGENTSPPLAWTGVPAGAAAVLLIIEDVDVPTARPGIHTIAVLEAPADGLAEGELNTASGAIRFVPPGRGRTGYVGPRPLPGHGPHHYRFHVLALDRIPGAATVLSDPDALTADVRGHVLAAGYLEGTRVA